MEVTSLLGCFLRCFFVLSEQMLVYLGLCLWIQAILLSKRSTIYMLISLFVSFS